MPAAISCHAFSLRYAADAAAALMRQIFRRFAPAPATPHAIFAAAYAAADAAYFAAIFAIIIAAITLPR